MRFTAIYKRQTGAEDGDQSLVQLRNGYHTILLSGHRLIFRTPYNPTDGPIELVFNHFEGELKRHVYKIRNAQDLMLWMGNIIRSFGPFRSFFNKVGFL